MSALRSLARASRLTMQRPAILASRPAQVFTRRSMASTPDSSHVSEVKVDAAAGGHTSQDVHGAHHDHYDPPTGWLWGVPPDQKYENEGWEGIWFYGFCGSLLLGTIAYAWKPDTSIETWALEEARRRLQAEGVLSDDA